MTVTSMTWHAWAALTGATVRQTLSLAVCPVEPTSPEEALAFAMTAARLDSGIGVVFGRKYRSQLR